MSAGSLREAYSLAHTAQCRLNLAASRPDRNLRFVVGHLMHYESLRLRIVEIEHDISKNERAQSVAFKGTGHYKFQPQSSPLRKSPPPPARIPDEEEYAEGDSTDSDDFPEDLLFDDEDEETVCGLGLQRFPSGTAKPPVESHPPPDLVPDNPAEPDESDDDDPPSPPECDQETLEKYVQGDGNVAMATVYNKVRSCPCHGDGDTPKFERMWRLPSDKHGIQNGVKTMKAIAQVA